MLPSELSGTGKSQDFQLITKVEAGSLKYALSSRKCACKKSCSPCLKILKLLLSQNRQLFPLFGWHSFFHRSPQFQDHFRGSQSETMRKKEAKHLIQSHLEDHQIMIKWTKYHPMNARVHHSKTIRKNHSHRIRLDAASALVVPLRGTSTRWAVKPDKPQIVEF